MAAATTGRIANEKPPSPGAAAAKFTARTSALPSTKPSTIRAARDRVFTDVSEVWIRAAARTPRRLIQVSTSTETTARIRCHDSPTSIGPLGSVSVNPANTSADSDGKNTAVKRANATATAAIVPVWITANSVQPYRKPNRGEMLSRR